MPQYQTQAYDCFLGKTRLGGGQRPRLGAIAPLPHAGYGTDHLSLRPRAQRVLVWVTAWQPPTRVYPYLYEFYVLEYFWTVWRFMKLGSKLGRCSCKNIVNNHLVKTMDDALPCQLTFGPLRPVRPERTLLSS